MKYFINFITHILNDTCVVYNSNYPSLTYGKFNVSRYILSLTGRRLIITRDPGGGGGCRPSLILLTEVTNSRLSGRLSGGSDSKMSRS